MKLRRNSDPLNAAGLTRLADGTAQGAEREALERAVAGSPELAGELAEQQRAVELLAALDVKAPEALHARLRTVEERPARPRRRHTTTRAAVIAITALAIAIVALARPTHQPEVRSVAPLALDAATLPAPTAHNHTILNVKVDRTAFPNWDWRGWRTSGSRLDKLDGHIVETVYYRAEGYERIGYSIVGGAALRLGSVQRTLRRGGVSYSVLADGPARVITWQRDGHTCVLASRHATVGTLLALAAVA